MSSSTALSSLYTRLGVLTLVWGTNWPLFPLAVREVSVWTFRGLALPLAGLVLLGMAWRRGYPLWLSRRDTATMVAASLVYLGIWNIASTYAAVMIPSGQAAILGFTMPLWLAALNRCFLQIRLTSRQRWALVLGGAGVGLLMWRGWQDYVQAPAGFALGLLAGLAWAGGTLILKRRHPQASSLVLTGWQLLVAAVPIGLGAWTLGDHQWFTPSLSSLLVMGYITLGPMCLGNLLWFSIVERVPAQIAALSSLSVPMVAMVSGAIARGEPLGLLQWTAMALSASALALTLMPPPRPR